MMRIAKGCLGLRPSLTSFWMVAVLILGTIHATPCIHLVGTVANKNLYTAAKEVVKHVLLNFLHVISNLLQDRQSFRYTRLTWFDALEYCHKIGMSLAVLESEREVMAVEDYLRRCKAKHHVWLAGTDLFKEGTFTWMNTGKAVDTDSVARWLDGQPDGGLRQNCLLINGLTLEWEDQACTFIYCRPLCQLIS